MTILIVGKDGKETPAGTSLMYNAGFDEHPQVIYPRPMTWEQTAKTSSINTFAKRAPKKGVSQVKGKKVVKAATTAARQLSAADSTAANKPLAGLDPSVDEWRDAVAQARNGGRNFGNIPVQLIQAQTVTQDAIVDYLWKGIKLGIYLITHASLVLGVGSPQLKAFESELRSLQKKTSSMQASGRNLKAVLKEIARLCQKYNVPIPPNAFHQAAKPIPAAGGMSGIDSPYDVSIGEMSGLWDKIKKGASKAVSKVTSGAKKVVKGAVKGVQTAGKKVIQTAQDKAKQALKAAQQAANKLKNWVINSVKAALLKLKAVFISKLANLGKSTVQGILRNAGLSGSSYEALGLNGVNGGDFGADRAAYNACQMGAVDAGKIATDFATQYVQREWPAITAKVGGAATGAGIASAGAGIIPAAIAAFTTTVLPGAMMELKKYATDYAKKEAAKLSNKVASNVTNELTNSIDQDMAGGENTPFPAERQIGEEQVMQYFEPYWEGT